MIKKTSHEWYQLDLEVDIIDPDGWRFDEALGDQSRSWFETLISEDEYSYRRNRSSVAGYGYHNHRPPFNHSEYSRRNVTKNMEIYVDIEMESDDVSDSDPSIEVKYIDYEFEISHDSEDNSSEEVSSDEVSSEESSEKLELKEDFRYFWRLSSCIIL